MGQPRIAARSMGEDIDIAPTGKVERRARRQELEAGTREGGPALALEHRVEAFAQAMPVEHVRGRVA